MARIIFIFPSVNSIISILVFLHGLVVVILGFTPSPKAAQPVPGDFWLDFLAKRKFMQRYARETQRKVIMVVSAVTGLVLMLAGVLLLTNPLLPISAAIVAVGAVLSLLPLIIFFDKQMLIGIAVDVALLVYVLVPELLLVKLI